MIRKQTTGRIMRANHGNASPRYLISFDTETRPVAVDASDQVRVHPFRLGVALGSRLRKETWDKPKVLRFGSPNHFWDFVYRSSGYSHTTWVAAHNLLFDLVTTGFTDEFTQGRLTLDAPRAKRQRENNDIDDVHSYILACLENPPCILGCRSTRTFGRIVFVDTLNWFRCPLSEIGANCGLPKLRMPDFDEPDSVWYPYCERDAEIVLKTIQDLIAFVRNNQLGNFRYTAASQAMAAYRHRFTTQKIYVHDNKQIKAIERNAYFGGRTEVFRRGGIDEDVWLLDVNSLFPYIMSTTFVPYKLVEYEIRDSYYPILPAIDANISIGECVLDTTQSDYPVRTGRLTIYPAGQFTTVLCGRELQHAIGKGYAVALRSWARYDTGIIFGHFVDAMYGLRQQYKGEGNEQYASLCKLLLNSLYGKFAQLSEQWIPCPNKLDVCPFRQWTEFDCATDTKQTYRTIGWQCFKQTERVERSTTFVAISAFITSAARMHMNRLRATAGHYNCYYQGVDGIVVNRMGFDRLSQAGELSETQLGKLKVSLQTNRGQIYGCCDYTLGSKTVVAGRYNYAKEIEQGTYQVRRFSGEKELFNNHQAPQMVETVSAWSRTKDYTKGRFNADGWFEPHQLAGTAESV